MDSKFSQVRVIEGQFVRRKPNWFELSGVSRNRGFEKSRVREIGGEIIERSKFNGNEVWFEISEGSGNRGFKKSGFHCIHVAQLFVVVKTFNSK